MPEEVFKIVACCLKGAPGPLLRLSMVCTAARDAVLKGSDQLWCEMLREYERSFFRLNAPVVSLGAPVVRNIPMRGYPNFKHVEGGGRSMDVPITWRLGRSEWPMMRGNQAPFTPQEVSALAAHSLRVFRLRTAERCGLCGARNKHVQVWGLGMRACSQCLKDNLVSGAALFRDYGVDFNKHEAQLAGKVFYFRQTGRASKNMAALLTHNPVDFKEENEDALVFFWRPHLERVLDLQQKRRELRDPGRRRAAQKISACVRTLRVRVFLAQKCKWLQGSDHSFHMSAPAEPKSKGGAYTVRPLTDEERRAILLNASYFSHVLPPAPTSLAQRARRLLQESFVGYRGPCTLPATRFPDSTLEKLRAIEAMRAADLVGRRGPSVLLTTHNFRKWFDLPPAL